PFSAGGGSQRLLVQRRKRSRLWQVVRSRSPRLREAAPSQTISRAASPYEPKRGPVFTCAGVAPGDRPCSAAPSTFVTRVFARFWADWDGTVMEQRGRNRWQTFGSPKGRKWLDLARTVATGCHQLPFESHGKQGVCRGLPPVAGGPLPEKEGVDSRTLGRWPGELVGRVSHCCSIMRCLLFARTCAGLVRQTGAESHRAEDLAKARSRM